MLLLSVEASTTSEKHLSDHIMNISSLQSKRLARVKAASTTRKVNFDTITHILTGNLQPQVGDLVLAKVEEIGQHKRIDLATGRKAHLFVGDEIIVVYGSRYAPDQFEAEVPLDLSPCHLIAAGGLAGMVVSQHIKIDIPTSITPIGLLADNKGQRINISDWALSPTNYIGQRPFTIAVVGTSMNSGKTTTAANMIRGLVNSGFRVGAAKITGTGSGNDTWLMRDAGASPIFDFTDVGFPSTYLIPFKELERILTTLLSQVAAAEVDVIVIEIADGLYQEETSKLVSSPAFRRSVDGILFAANSALAATAGVLWLKEFQIPVLAISGVVTMSPLASRETSIATGLPVLDIEMLQREAANLIALSSQPQISLPTSQEKITVA